jgi:FAD/FMN-containing dehydrogenase
MSKVAAYLQEHIQGEVSTNGAVLKALSTDGSVLEIAPEMVVYPRVTNDIRKVARFTWQLAEKGHVLPLTPRGNGTDLTGAAIGKGIILALPAHMNAIFELDVKQKLVRLQPGLNAKALNDALALHGLTIPSSAPSSVYSTIGGMVANNTSGPLSAGHGTTGSWVYQLEVVLANGDVLQTGRLSKRDLSKKKGSQGFEGEIYRSLDNLITDNQDIINQKLVSDIRDNVGYSSIAQVKQKDGSFDLTPLFIGSQGTLGIISEMIMRAEFMSAHSSAAAISFASSEAARDAIDVIAKFSPAVLEYLDSSFFELAASRGKTYDFYKNANSTIEAVLLVGFNDFSDRSNTKKLKKMSKLLAGEGIQITGAGGEQALELLATREVTSYLLNPEGRDTSAPPLFDGAFVPNERFEDFLTAVRALAVKHNVTLPIYGRVLEGLIFTRPVLQLHKVGDKQKLFKLLDEFASLIAQFGGHLIGDNGEGRVKANFAYKQLDSDVLELFAAVKSIFDPHGTLNPGVKQSAELRVLVSHLRQSYDTASIAQYAQYF